MDKACFAHVVGYPDSKDFPKRCILDEILKNRAFEIVRNCNYDEYQKVCKCFAEKTGSGMSVNE